MSLHSLVSRINSTFVEIDEWFGRHGAGIPDYARSELTAHLQALSRDVNKLAERADGAAQALDDRVLALRAAQRRRSAQASTLAILLREAGLTIPKLRS